MKKACPWCISAENYLRERGYHWREVDVSSNSAAFAEMKRISGQTFAPTLTVGDKMLADFGPEELAAFLEKNGINPA